MCSRGSSSFMNFSFEWPIESVEIDSLEWYKVLRKLREFHFSVTNICEFPIEHFLNQIFREKMYSPWKVPANRVVTSEFWILTIFNKIGVGWNYYEFAKWCWYDESHVSTSSPWSIAASIFPTRRIGTISTHTEMCPMPKPWSRKLSSRCCAYATMKFQVETCASCECVLFMQTILFRRQVRVFRLCIVEQKKCSLWLRVDGSQRHAHTQLMKLYFHFKKTSSARAMYTYLFQRRKDYEKACAHTPAAHRLFVSQSQKHVPAKHMTFSCSLSYSKSKSA